MPQKHVDSIGNDETQPLKPWNGKRLKSGGRINVLCPTCPNCGIRTKNQNGIFTCVRCNWRLASNIVEIDEI